MADGSKETGGGLRAVRSRGEIVAKRDEMAASVDSLEKRLKKIRHRFAFATLIWVLIFSVFIVLQIIDKNEKGWSYSAAGEVWFPIALDVFLFLTPVWVVLLVLVHLSFEKKIVELQERRNLICLAFDEVVSMLGSRGIEAMYAELESMTINRARKKKKALSYADDRPDRRKQLYEEARLEAYTWAASPGGVQEKE